MGRFVIVAYAPKPGRESALLALLRKHLQVLRGQQLVSERPACVMRAGNGTLLEVFEWRSAQAIEQAHKNPAVMALWGEFEAACDYVPLSMLDETRELFAEFDAVEP